MNKKELAQHLRKLANKEVEPEILVGGICAEMMFKHVEQPLYLKCREIMMDWPKYSGDYTFPIPDPAGFIGPSAIYSITSSDDMWSPLDFYGALRLELCAFIADELEKEDE